MAAPAGMVRIGERPLHIALGAGHHNADRGDPFETGLNGRVCRAVVALARNSSGFEVRCYTPDDGLGFHPGRVDDAPRHVATDWDPAWTVDLFHEVHAQSVPNRPEERGVFIIYPDGGGLASDYPNPGEIDQDVQAHGLAMAGIIAATTGLPIGGQGKTGIMSERATWVGGSGRRLRVFAATATSGMVGRSCRFISEVGCYSNPRDKAIMSRADFPHRESVGILRAYALLATTCMGWSYAYRIAADPADR